MNRRKLRGFEGLLKIYITVNKVIGSMVVQLVVMPSLGVNVCVHGSL